MEGVRRLDWPPREGPSEGERGPKWAPRETPRAGVLAAKESAPAIFILKGAAPGDLGEEPPRDIESGGAWRKENFRFGEAF